MDQHGEEGDGDDRGLERQRLSELEGRATQERMERVVRGREWILETVVVFVLNEQVRVPAAGLEALVDREHAQCDEDEPRDRRRPAQTLAQCGVLLRQ